MGQLGDISPEGSVAIGIIVGLLSTSIQSLGLTLQRKSHLIEDAKDEPETRRPPYKRRKWQIGMAMFVASNLIGSTIQITTLPLPVLSTLQASGLVFNTAFATILLKEPFTKFSVIGTVLTCVGAALIATFGAIAEPAHNLGQLLALLRERDFIIWMVGTLVVTVATILLAHLLKVWSSHKHIEEHFLKHERQRSASSVENPGSNGIKRSFTAALPQPLQVKVSRLRLMRGLCYALISGILSAHSLLMAKSAVELLVRTIVDHHNQFNRFQSWLILLALLFFALTQLYYLHLGLRLCSTSVLYPFVFCIYNIIAILDGLIYFQQASRMSGLHAGLVAVGTVILLLGVLALSWRLDDTPPVEATHQSVPQTPLTPGMGLVRGSEDSEREPLLPTTRSRSSTSASRKSMDEHSPMLRRKHRPSTFSARQPPAEVIERDIWAELDDEGSDQDVLASLPRPASPLLNYRRTRHRGDSASSLAISSTSRRSSADSKGSRKPSPMAKGHAADGSRRSSAPHVKPDAEEHIADVPTRPRSQTVRFAEDTQGSRQQSRWDSRWLPDKQKDEDDDENKPQKSSGV